MSGKKQLSRKRGSSAPRKRVAIQTPESLGFRMPTDRNPSNRKTSIRAATWAHILPREKPTAPEVRERLEMLGISAASTVECIYCGSDSGSWDHLNPIVDEKTRMPTGYYAEKNNLVPSCLSCNSSKGNKRWMKWMRGTAKKSPTVKGVKGRKVLSRINALNKFVKSFPPKKCDLTTWSDSEAWRAVLTALSAAEQSIDLLHKQANALKTVMESNAIAGDS